MAILFLLVFSLHFWLSAKSIKSYLQIEAYDHAQDTATSLSLSLSPYISDETDPMLETMIKAIFDMGAYQEIKLTNLDGKILVSVANLNITSPVPSWFANILPMPPICPAVISRQVGIQLAKSMSLCARACIGQFIPFAQRHLWVFIAFVAYRNGLAKGVIALHLGALK